MQEKLWGDLPLISASRKAMACPQSFSLCTLTWRSEKLKKEPNSPPKGTTAMLVIGPVWLYMDMTITKPPLWTPSSHWIRWRCWFLPKEQRQRRNHLWNCKNHSERVQFERKWPQNREGYLLQDVRSAQNQETGHSSWRGCWGEPQEAVFGLGHVQILENLAQPSHKYRKESANLQYLCTLNPHLQL